MKQKYFTICFHDLFLKYYPKMTIKSQSKDYTIFAEINSRIRGDNDSNLAAFLSLLFSCSQVVMKKSSNNTFFSVQKEMFCEKINV